MTAFVLSSCSETDETETTSEYANWQARNDEAFAKVMNTAKADATHWDTYLAHTLIGQIGNTTTDGTVYKPTYSINDSIAVEKRDNVLEIAGKSPKAITPLISDSVKVAYQGRLMPTPEHPLGYMFDGTFEGTSYNDATALTSKFKTGDLVVGFSTALMHMTHIGDHYIVYMPYTLGYKSAAKTGIPAYSMLCFEIVLKGVKRGNNWIE